MKKSNEEAGATIVNNLQAILARAAGRKITVKPSGEDGDGLEAEALIGLALIDPEYGPETSGGAKAGSAYLDAMMNDRERALWERQADAIAEFAEKEWAESEEGEDGEEMPDGSADAFALTRYRRLRKEESFAGLHVGVRKVLSRCSEALSRSRKMLLRYLNRHVGEKD